LSNKTNLAKASYYLLQFSFELDKKVHILTVNDLAHLITTIIIAIWLLLQQKTLAVIAKVSNWKIIL